MLVEVAVEGWRLGAHRSHELRPHRIYRLPPIANQPLNGRRQRPRHQALSESLAILVQKGELCNQLLLIDILRILNTSDLVKDWVCAFLRVPLLEPSQFGQPGFDDALELI